MIRKFRGTVILLLAGLTMGCEQEVKRTQMEFGPNTLAAEQAMQRERLSTAERMQKELLQTQKKQAAERRTECWLEGRRYCATVGGAPIGPIIIMGPEQLAIMGRTPLMGGIETTRAIVPR